MFGDLVANHDPAKIGNPQMSGQSGDELGLLLSAIIGAFLGWLAAVWTWRLLNWLAANL